MERENNNTVVAVVITILVMIILGFGAYFVYDKFLINDNEPNIEENNSVNQNSSKDESDDQITNDPNKQENNNTGNDDSQSSTSGKYSYKLVPANSQETEQLNNILYLWESGVDEKGFGMTGFSGSFPNNKTLEIYAINNSNKISFSSSVISYADITDANICTSLNCESGSMNIIFLLNSGELYFCNEKCLIEGKNEDDMQLVLTDKSVQGIANVNGSIFVKNTDGIKKMVYSN